MRRSWRELSNAYLLAKFGFDTAANEPSKARRRSVPPGSSAKAEVVHVGGIGDAQDVRDSRATGAELRQWYTGLMHAERY